MKTICMKCQIQFSQKNVILSSAELAHRVVKVTITSISMIPAWGIFSNWPHDWHVNKPVAIKGISDFYNPFEMKRRYQKFELKKKNNTKNSLILVIQISSIHSKGSGPPPRSAPKGAPTEIKNGSYVETLPRRQTILYVRLDDFLGRVAALRLLPQGPSSCGPKWA